MGRHEEQHGGQGRQEKGGHYQSWSLLPSPHPLSHSPSLMIKKVPGSSWKATWSLQPGPQRALCSWWFYFQKEKGNQPVGIQPQVGGVTAAVFHHEGRSQGWQACAACLLRLDQNSAHTWQLAGLRAMSIQLPSPSRNHQRSQVYQPRSLGAQKCILEAPSQPAVCT